jgi:4-aminobutyrate aminotransferase-like enzyme/Ser/Thr protein kinase RdoA (MazF antagonist)
MTPATVDVFAAAADRFGLVPAEIVPLPGELTRNARVTGAAGKAVVLKVHPEHETPDVDLEVAALDALARGPAAAMVPRVVRTPAGEHRVEVGDRIARALTWLPGTVWADAGPATPERLNSLGAAVARVDAALAGFDHPHLGRPLRWNLVTAADQRELLPHVADPERAGEAAAVLDLFAERVAPALAALPAQAVHNDANDRNVLVDGDRVTGLLDFGDLCRAPRICGLAVAAAYALPVQGAADPRALSHVVAGYHAVAPLRPAELALLPDLVRTRLALSIVLAGWQSARDPGNDYLLVSQDHVWAALRALPPASADGGDELLAARLRAACGYEPVATARAVRAHLATVEAAPVLGRPLPELGYRVLDWSAGGTPEAAPEGLVGVGRYCEHRAVYTTAAFAPQDHGPQAAPDEPDERRTVHLGVDLFVPPGTPVHAPLPGVVRAAADNAEPLDYGPVVVLEHATPDGVPFFTLYGHLSRAGLAGVREGLAVAAGEVIGSVGTSAENGGWPPHVHVQVLTALVGVPAITTPVTAPGVAPRAELALWQSVSPDPNLLLGLASGTRADPGMPAAEIARRRATLMSPALSLSYAEPLHIVRGEGQYLVDAAGRRWLDLVNNVAHVGHAHPRVVAAAAAQNALLNTNTRYLHEAVAEYARRLTETLPDPLSVCFFVNSGSEANDLALRLAHAHTRARDVLVLDHAYHGHLVSLIDVSPYKFDGPGGLGRPPTTHVVPLPDPYRGRYRTAPGVPSAEVTPAYLEEVDVRVDGLAAAGRRPAAFLSEPLPGTAGQVVLADRFLAGAYERVRAVGGICIADEVQIGVGRPGAAMWGFELQGVVPDVVTMGKPLGNGHPLGAVVTTPEVAASFLTGMEYFNTFGGNPVSARVGLAVLDVVADERLQQRADGLGRQMLAGLRELADRHDLIGDVRGSGLFVGVELVHDRAARTPAGAAAARVVEEVKARGVLISTDGPEHNVLKVKPPMVLTEGDVDHFVAVLDEALAVVRPEAAR